MPPHRKPRISQPAPIISSGKRILRHYKTKLCQIPYPLTCPICKESLQYTHFEKHCQTLHNLNPQLVCVWCRQYNWNKFQKYKNMDHIIDCLNRFKNLQHQAPATNQPSTSSAPTPATDQPSTSSAPTPAADQPSTSPKLLNLQVQDEKLSSFDHDIQYLPPRAHDFPCRATLTPYPLLFQNDALNLAVSCVLLYLDNPDYEWFHVSIRIPAYARFVELVEANSDCVLIIPFSCWCDGGEESRTEFRQHRHMIVACTRPDYFLNNIWRKIKILKSDKPSASYKALYYTPIQNPRHFVMTILYVSKRQSQCKFASKKQPNQNNHFFLSESLTREYALPLVLLWDNGIYELIQLTTLKLNRVKLVASPHLKMNFSKYCMKIKDIPKLPLNNVLPVDHWMEPCGYETDYKLHLMNGQKMYFDVNEELEGLAEEDWLQRQAEMGNLFYNVVGERFWTPNIHQQSLITDFKPFVDTLRKVEVEIEQLREANHELRRTINELTEVIGELKEIIRCGAKIFKWQFHKNRYISN